MNAVESPLNTAHQHAANADEFMSQGLLIPASEEHEKAAQAFQECIEASSDENAKRTLRMLFNEHSKANKDLQRRIAKMREEHKDPTLPQTMHSKRPTNAPSSAPSHSASPPPQSRTRMAESQNTVDESFMLLGQRSDPGDLLFNQFWKVTTELLENISQPVAFASAPLGYQTNSPYPRRDTGSSSDTDIDDGLATRLSKKIGLTRRTPDTSFSAAREGSFTRKSQATVSNLQQDLDEVFANEDDDLAESFFLIPSDDETTIIKRDNLALKARVAELEEQLRVADSTLKARQEQDQVLRGNVLAARREAQRVMTASTIGQPRPVPDLGSLNLTVTPTHTAPPGRDREAQLSRRVRELEEDLKVLRAENESQKQMIVRFRERWNQLKESAKRKKEAKAAAVAAAAPVREKIPEEPEPEDDFQES